MDVGNLVSGSSASSKSSLYIWKLSINLLLKPSLENFEHCLTSIWPLLSFLNLLVYWVQHFQFSSVQLLSRVRLFVTPWTAAYQASLTITNSRSLPKLMSIESVMPSNHLILSSPSPPALNLYQHQGLFKWFFTSGGQSIGVSASASILPMNTQDLSPLGWTGWISQECSPTPQFKSINSSALSLLHSPTLTSIHDHWKNHSLD